ncbi:MAG: pitrilysin family protein [Candidatus Krumholzibacteriia bacterium]
MTRRRIAATAVLLAALLILNAAVAGAAGKKPWEKIAVPELGDIELPEYERVELENGMVLYLMEDDEFPLVDFSATIQAGTIYDPADKIGLASMTGTVMRSGGTASRTGDEIDALVEARGMRLNIGVGDATASAYLSTLTEDLDLGLELLADVLMNPAFAEDKIALAKEEQKAVIARRNDEPMSIAQREAVKVLLGPDHPLARHPEYDTIAAVAHEDMQQYHRRYFAPDRTYLVVIGDFEAGEIANRIEQAFAGWEKASEALPPDPEIPDLPRTVNVAAKEGLTQATIVLGHKGIRNDDPDYAALVVGNRILGGGFSSRLFNEIRSKLGYAYSVGSSAGTGWRYPGTFLAFTMTKNQTVEAATRGILAEIERMRDEPVSELELQQARDALLNSEVFNYANKRAILDRLVLFEMYGYPEDFLLRYMDEVRQLTAADIQSAVQRHWQPDRLTILAVGEPADWDGDLSSFGPVNSIDISIPEPSLAMEIPEATPESLAEGRRAMEQLREKSGGKKLAALKGYQEKSEIDATIQGMPLTFKMTKTVIFPDRLHLLTKTPFGDMTQVVAGDAGWATGPQGSQDMGAEQVAETRREISGDIVAMLHDLDDYEFQALEPRQVEGIDVLPIHVDLDGGNAQILFLTREGELHMVQSPSKSPVTGSPVTQKVYVDSYQDVDGFHLPHTMRILHDDEEFATATVTSFEADPKDTSGLFER